MLRRVALIEMGFVGPVLIGALQSPDVRRLSNFLERNGIPFRVVDPVDDRDGSSLLAPESGQLPIVVLSDGTLLKNPAKQELALALGLMAPRFRSEPYDVAIVGAGPAGLAQFEGRGISYWASPVEARLCRAADVALLGGGNSAGQAAVFLASHARRVLVLVRAPGLSSTMSRYLIDRIAASPNIEVLCEPRW